MTEQFILKGVLCLCSPPLIILGLVLNLLCLVLDLFLCYSALLILVLSLLALQILLLPFAVLLLGTVPPPAPCEAPPLAA